MITTSSSSRTSLRAAGRRAATGDFADALGAEVDGVEFAALDTLHDGLAGDAHRPGELGLREARVDPQDADDVLHGVKLA